jgi:hypothetical protein
MAVGSGSKQPPISRPIGGQLNGLNGGSGSLVLSSLLSNPPTASNGLNGGLAQSIATLANNVSNGGSTSPTGHSINGSQGGGGGGGNSLKGFMMERQQQQPPPPQQQQQQQYLSGLSSPLPNLCVNSSLSQVCV